MKLVLLAIGRMKTGPERELLQRYLKRAEIMGRNIGLTDVQSIEIYESRARAAEQRKREEAATLRGRLPADASTMLLDQRGESLRSEVLALTLAQARDAGIPAMVFCIGGPDGLDPDFILAHRCLAFGAATFPHQLVRVLMAEQLYRAITILSGHPYHRL